MDGGIVFMLTEVMEMIGISCREVLKNTGTGEADILSIVLG